MSTPDFSKLGLPMLDKDVQPEALDYLLKRGHTRKSIAAANFRYLRSDLVRQHFSCSYRGIAPDSKGVFQLDANTKACWWPLWAIVLPWPDNPEYGVTRIEYKILELGSEKEPHRYVNPFDVPCPPYFPKSVSSKALRDAKQTLYIVEGYFKSLVAAERGLVAIGVNGHAGAFEPDTKLEKIKAALHPYLKPDRRVCLLTDADCRSNLEVRRSLLQFMKATSAEPFKCKPVFIELPESKSGPGIDDYFGEGRTLADFHKLTPHAHDSQEVLLLSTAFMNLTELGLANRFVATYKDVCRADPRTAEWYTWTKRGYRNDLIEAERRMIELIEKLPVERAADKNPLGIKARKTFEKECEHLHMRNHALTLAANDRQIEIDSARFDSDPNLLGFENGILDLTAGKLREPGRDLLVTKSTGYKFDAKATAPRFTKFMQTAVQGDQDLLRYLQDVAGATLLGRAIRTSIHVFYGEAYTGRTVLIETLLAMLGEYGQASKADLLLRQNSNPDAEKPSPLLLSLRGKRLVVCSELAKGTVFDDALIKDLTGADTIQARGLHKDPVTFKNTAAIIVRSNHPPTIGNDTAIRSRVNLAPFTHVMPPAKRDKLLVSKITASELPGVLNWALVGLRRYVKRGYEFKLPEVVLKATEQMQLESDVIGLWLDDCYEVDATRTQAPWRTDSNDVVSSYRQWCSQNLHKNPFSAKSLLSDLRKRFGFPDDVKQWPLRSHGKKWATGFKPIAEPVVADAVETFLEQLATKDEIIKLKSDKLQAANREIAALKAGRRRFQPGDQGDSLKNVVVSIEKARHRK